MDLIKADKNLSCSLPQDKLFDKVIYFVIGFISDEVLKELKSSNAVQSKTISDSVTHCVIGKNCIKAHVSASVESYGAKTVTPEWVIMSNFCKKLLPTKPYNPFENHLFSGIIVSVTQLTANDCKILWALVTYNGGTFSPTLDFNKTTHLIVARPFGMKYDAVLKNGSNKIKIVTPDWFINCIKSNILYSEINYHPKLLVAPKISSLTKAPFIIFESFDEKQRRLSSNKYSISPKSQYIKDPSSQIAQETIQLKTSPYKISTSQLQQLTDQEFENYSQHGIDYTEQEIDDFIKFNNFQRTLETDKFDHTIKPENQIQLEHGHKLQIQTNQQQNVKQLKFKKEVQFENQTQYYEQEKNTAQIQQDQLSQSQEQNLQNNNDQQLQLFPHYQTNQSHHQQQKILLHQGGATVSNQCPTAHSSTNTNKHHCIHLYSKTEQEIRAMTHDERILFLYELLKDRQFILQRLRQIENHSGDMNIIRPLNSQINESYQAIPFSRFLQRKIMQLNQIHKKQCLVQQYQTDHETFINKLPIDIKILNNILVNDQQAVQPQNSVCQQSTITKQHDDLNTISMSINQMNQKPQLKLKTEIQEIVSDKTNSEIQKNVFQYHKVPISQTCIVKPQYTQILTSNEQTEIQTLGPGPLYSETVLYNTSSSSLPIYSTKAEGCTTDLNDITYQQNFQARYFGHDPHTSIPKKCFLGCIFLIVEYDQYPKSNNFDVSKWKPMILKHGGIIETFYSIHLTHIVCQTQKHPFVQQGLHDGKRCITAHWLNDVIIKQQLMPPWHALHFPIPFNEERPCRQMLLSLTNFEGEERNRVKFMIELIGAQFTSYLSVENDILVSRKLEGRKVKKALDINLPVVNIQWINEIIFGNFLCINHPENEKYQQFNLENPFEVDYNLVLHLMEAWKTPICITQEPYDREYNNSSPTNININLSYFMNSINNDSSSNAIIVHNKYLPPIEYSPCVMFTGFSLVEQQLHKRLVLELGGLIAQNYLDVTHLIMKEPVRTIPFLCCISTVKHIVTVKWLKDSSTQHIFLDELNYTIKEVSIDQKVICKVHEVLSNTNRHELFKGKIFFITPGVKNPSVKNIRKIIESAGGTVENQRRSLRSIRKLAPNTYIVITCDDDLHLVAYLNPSFHGIYSAEFVLSAVMTQCVNYDI